MEAQAAVLIGTWTLVLLIAVALAFDFMNGFHDGANSIATIVATGAMTPKQAVLFAATLNFVAIWVFQLKVAATVGKGVIDPSFVDHYVIFGCLVGALFWNIVTWYYGIPSSSSHALIGGLVGATIAKIGGGDAIVWGSLWQLKGLITVLCFIILSPLLGFLIGGTLQVLTAWIFRNQTPYKVGRWFMRAQIVSAGLYSLAHGGNDAQKTIGIIWLLLITAGAGAVPLVGHEVTKDVSTLPMWVVYSCYLAIAWGTYLGGWRIVKTMGSKITKLTPVSGSNAALGGGITLGLATMAGIPVSTTHTITGSIFGVGSTRGKYAVRWGLAGRIVMAWVLTIPASGLVAAIFWWIGTKTF
jgi:PiT family inorganic phosphate transporter